MSELFITGASGFIGQALTKHLIEHDDTTVRACVRSSDEALPSDVNVFQCGNISAETNWHDALIGIDCVIHTAARAHIVKETETDPLLAFRKVNVDGTLNLARQAVSTGVRRFIFISSVGVTGNRTNNNRLITEQDEPKPWNFYATSKYEAEQGLRQIAAETGMEVVIIRPPLVYGPAVKANFLTMMRWLSKSIPLPLAAVDNKRSLVALDNLIDFIMTCIEHPNAANQTFLVSDGEDLSTPELLRRTASAMGKRARLFSMPPPVLNFFAKVAGKQLTVSRLCDSLQVDISKARDLLDWQPPVSVDEALQKTAEDFLSK